MSDNILTSTELGKLLSCSAKDVNALLSGLGLICRSDEGWQLLPLGREVGGIQKRHSMNGNMYVVWNKVILNHPAILEKTAGCLPNNDSEPASTSVIEKTNQNSNFREKFKANLRAIDGHHVRSRAELLIDNFLYMAEIVHAYERKLPIEEDVYCDFYLPTGKVYVEFWGLEKDAKYTERKNVKIELYRKHELNLIEVNDKDIENLDDVLPSRLLQFGIRVS